MAGGVVGSVHDLIDSTQYTQEEIALGILAQFFREGSISDVRRDHFNPARTHVHATERLYKLISSPNQSESIGI